MDVEAQIDPALDDRPKPIEQAIKALRRAAASPDLRWAFESGLAADAPTRFAEHVKLVEQRLTGGDVEGAWYALARAVEFAGYCRGAAATRFAAQEEVRQRDASKARLAQEARARNTTEQNRAIADKVVASPADSPVWRSWYDMEGMIRTLIREDIAPHRDTPGRVKAICKDPRLAPVVARLKPPPARRQNRLTPPGQRTE